MSYPDKENSLSVVKDVEILLILFAFLTVLMIGCKEKTEPALSGSQPVVQAASSDEKPAQMLEEDRQEKTDEAEEVEGESDEDIAGNNPPEVVALKLVPNVIYPGTKVTVEAEGKDMDDDNIVFYYRWEKNQALLPGEESEELDTSGFKKGDLVTAFVVPFDGLTKGKEVMSPSLLVSNRPPDITSAPLGSIIDGVFVYDVSASDPDGDELVFSLEGSPEGMAIDASTGRVEWKIPDDAKGPFSVKVVVSDGDATTFQGFQIGEIVRELR